MAARRQISAHSLIQQVNMVQPALKIGALVGLLALGGCITRAEQGPCPTFGILKDAEYYPAPEGTGPNTPYLAEITDIDVTCRYQGKNKPVRAELEMRVAVSAKSEGSFTASIPYFVAVARGDDIAIGRESFTVNVNVNEGRGAKTESVDGIYIPLAAGLSGASYHVFAGFELSPAQVARIRKGPALPALPADE